MVKPEELKVGQVVRCEARDAYLYRGYMRILYIEPWKWGGEREGHLWITGEQVRKDGELRKGAAYLKNAFADDIAAIIKQPEEVQP